ncbi:MAG: SsrA-binding protein SmpB [Dehalococcoidia bacterium]
MSPTKQKKSKKPEAKQQDGKPQIRTVADNRRAFYDYDLLERAEAGVALSGTEIKSVRAAKANIRDAYAQVRNGEVWLQNMHISPWTSGGPWNHEPVHPRRLLLHKKEIDRLGRIANQQGLTIIPLRIYIKGHHAKVELALAKGRRRHDKRQAIMQRETDREIARSIKRAY